MKLGITMEGGASRTMFSSGVADALLEAGILPDYFIGVSAGIGQGISYLSGQYRRNLDVAVEYMADKRYMGIKYLLDKKKRSLYNVDFVFGEVPDRLVPFDFEAFRAFQGQVVAVVTNVHTGKAEYMDVPRDTSCYPLLMASCALPLAFQPVKWKKHYYLDGGIADSIPFEQAMREGCDKNIVILTRERGYQKKQGATTQLAARLYKNYPKMAEALLTRAERYNACMARLEQLEAEKKVFVVAPESTFGMKRTEKRAEPLRRLYEAGYQQMKKQLPELRDYLGQV